MTSYSEWDGIGPITATSVDVIGANNEILIDNNLAGSPPGAEIQFIDRSGNNADPAIISSQRDPFNAMTLDLNAGIGTNGNQAGITMNTDFLSLDFTATVSGNSSRVKLTDAAPGYVAVLPYVAVEGETWHSLAMGNGWTPNGALPFQYYLEPSARVFFRGISAAGNLGAGTVIATLPAGWRPAREANFSIGSDGAATNIIKVSTNGNIAIFNAAAGNYYWDGSSFSILP